MRIIKFFVLFFIILTNQNCLASASNKKIKVFYAGFSLSNIYESNEISSKYTSILLKEARSQKQIDIISDQLVKKINNSSFQDIDLDINNLIDFDKYPDNAIVMSIALQSESFSQEFNLSSNLHMGFYDAYFQILFYDFSDKNLIASIPFDFEIQMLSKEKINNNQILNRIKNFYLKDDPFKNLDERINKFKIKRKYDRRIGVTKVNILNKAFEVMPKNSIQFVDVYKILLAQTFEKRLSKNHNIAIVPYNEGQSIGKFMKLRFVQVDKIYTISLPDPDYHVHIDLKGFKKVLAKSTDVEDLFLYGSFVDIKILQPDINKIYFDHALRGVTKVKIPKEQLDINEWRKYYYNIETLFDNFSTNITKPESKWLKEVTKNNIKKNLKDISFLLEKVK